MPASYYEDEPICKVTFGDEEWTIVMRGSADDDDAPAQEVDEATRTIAFSYRSVVLDSATKLIRRVCRVVFGVLGDDDVKPPKASPRRVTPSISNWPHPKPDKTRDHDNDRGRIKPAAWKHVKKAMGGRAPEDRLFKALEDQAGNGCVHLVFFAALLAYAQLPEEERTDAIFRFINWQSQERDAAKAMERIAASVDAEDPAEDPASVLPRNAA